MRYTLTIISVLAIMAIQSNAQMQRVKVGVGYAASATTTAQEFVFEQGPNSDLITTGDFASDTNWTKAGGWAIAGGVATYTNSAAATGTLSQVSLDVTENLKYRLTYTVAGVLAGQGSTITPTIGTSPYTAVTTNGTYTEDVIFYGTNTLAFTLISTNGVTNTIDNVYLRQAPAQAWVDVLQLTSATNAAQSVYFAFNCDSDQFSDIYTASRAMILPPTQDLGLDYGQQKEPIRNIWYKTSTGTASFTINAR